jgi:hypothetical protein
MDFQIAISIVLSLLCTLTTVLTLRTLSHKSKAEREYLSILKEQASTFQALRNRAMHDGVVTNEELMQIVASLDSASEALSTEHRKLVLTGLHQPSLRGRARYAAKLLNKAGIGSGSLPIASP